MNSALKLKIVEENPILSATAQAENAMERYIVSACDGNALAAKIVTTATGLRRTAELLAKLPRVSAGDYAILTKRCSDLDRLVESDEENAALAFAPEINTA